MYTISKNVKALFRGLWRTLCGAFVAAGVGAACYGYTLIPTVDGYEAVIRFLIATIMLGLSLHLMWCMGGGRRRIITVEEDR